MKTICLIGMMGSGKTTVAKMAAQFFGIKFVDIDIEIEQIESMTISEIFAKKGEKYFRNLEKITIKDIYEPEDMIISLGGGAFEDIETRQFLLENAKVIYLKTSAQTIFKRIKNDTSRPLLCGKMSVESIDEILQKREKNYLLAHKIVNTDNKSIENIVWELRND